MSTQAIAADLVALCKAGRFNEPGEKYWADDVVSIEAMGPPGADLAARGRAAVEAKGKWWADNHEVANSVVEGPYVAGDQFVVGFTMDVTMKADGQTRHMEEMALYTVKNDRIVEERFFYKG